MKKRTKTIVRILLFVGTAISLFFVPWDLLKIRLTPASDTVQEQVDAAIEMGLDGIIVYVDEAGKKPEFYTAGWNNRAGKTPVNPDLYFKIASISKLYIAAATAKLVATDSLSLDKTLAEYLPEFKDRIEYSDQITLKMMVNHTSGIYNYSDNPDFPWADPPTNEEAFKFGLDQPANFKPGTQYGYSNTNYLLLGEILDKTLGYSHHEYIKEEIVHALGLSHTFSLLSDVNADDVMSGYFVGYEPDIKNQDYVNPGGSMVATIQDVGVFMRALNDGTLFNEKEREIYSDIYEYNHTGELPGYLSIARYHKDIDAVVIQFVNTSGGTSWSKMEIVYNRIIGILKDN